MISVLCSYDGDAQDDENVSFCRDACLKGFHEYPYCIMMEATDKNLTRLVLRSDIAGRDWAEVRRILKQG